MCVRAYMFFEQSHKYLMQGKLNRTGFAFSIKYLTLTPSPSWSYSLSKLQAKSLISS